MRCVLLALLLASTAAQVHAQPVQDPAPLVFTDDTERVRFHHLVAELRCVMCQNQSLADSNAQIAHDLRREVLDLMRQGKDDAAIKAFLVARYGEFVLYRPRLGAGTVALWLGPFLLLVGGGLVVARTVHRRERQPVPPADDTQEW